ncbi:MAG: ABC-2 transporter permease [Lachnospiraceae bacterium]|jgi:ABC-2 type transport system permease protein|nr:ABC-2 transporter permease [Lachnospiraceae bacterium]
MKGLLIKDIRLMKNMRNSIIMILLIAVSMGAYMKDVSFIITYLALIGASFTTSTMSYDEFDNGYTFLLSLPVTRKGYVLEKYAFGLLLGGGGWLLGSVIVTVAGAVRNTSTVTDSLMMSLVMLPVALLLLSVLIPFHMKFGGEKGRIVMIITIGLIFAATVLGVKLAEAMNIDLDAALEKLPVMGTGAVAVGAVVISVVILLLSCRISIGIMNKKEF